jgi:hypothetical protein
MKYIFSIFIVISISFLTLNLKADTRKVSNNETKIILHDGMFINGLPVEFWLDDSKKNGIWGWGNWENKDGKANFWFSQAGPERILTELGMLPKKVLKNWGVENYKLGKKKGFKSSGGRALTQLVNINNKNCVVVISRFGSSFDAQSRVRTGVEGYICKNKGEISIDDGKNFMHCIEVKNQGTHFIGKEIDDKCIKKTKEIDNNVSNKKTTNENSETISKKSIKENNNDSLEEKLKKLKFLFETNLITKKEYDEKRKEILDENF